MANDTIKIYVSRQLQEQGKILKLSTHDRDGKVYPFRYFFFRVKKHFEHFLEKNEPRWITIPGLRGVGKTTILAQLFSMYRSRFNNRVLYVSLDEVVHKMGGDLFAVLDAYAEVLGESFPSLKENVLLLVDEVHFDPKWQDALKTLYDKSRKIFIVSTGSSAIAINRTADVARRSLVEKMYPLQFTEYVMLSDGIHPTQGLGERVRRTLFESATSDDVFDGLKGLENEVRLYWEKVDKNAISKYIQYYSLPSVLPYDDPIQVYQLLNTMLDKIVRKDLPGMYPFSHSVISKISNLLYLIASSDVRSTHDFAQDLGIDEKTLSSVFRVLEDAELLLRVYPYSSSAPKKVRKPSKYLFFAPSLRAALVHLIDPQSVLFSHKGKLLEDSVGMHLYNYISDKGLSFGYDDAQGGADLIVGGIGKKIVIEVGWKKDNIGQVLKTMGDTGGDYGLLITDSHLLKKNKNVVTVPFEYFFLL